MRCAGRWSWPKTHGEGLQQGCVVEPIDERERLDILPERGLRRCDMAALEGPNYRVWVTAPVEAAQIVCLQGKYNQRYLSVKQETEAFDEPSMQAGIEARLGAGARTNGRGGLGPAQLATSVIPLAVHCMLSSGHGWLHVLLRVDRSRDASASA